MPHRQSTLPPFGNGPLSPKQNAYLAYRLWEKAAANMVLKYGCVGVLRHCSLIVGHYRACALWACALWAYALWAYALWASSAAYDVIVIKTDKQGKTEIRARVLGFSR